jgi:anaerobic selenocysteine-containing dehydrogenase
MSEGKVPKRRRFLKQTAAGVVGAGLGVAGHPTTAASQSRVAGANRRIRVALIGCGGMGGGDLRDFLRVGNTECVALCDVDDAQMAKMKETVGRDFKQTPATANPRFPACHRTEGY